MPEITRITSEALQATIRRLLPSQQGFGTDLEASNVITPIIDLTPTAEGSLLGVNLQTAINFGGNTAFNVSNTTSTLVNTAGFHRIYGTVTRGINNATGFTITMSLTNGLSTKIILDVSTIAVGYDEQQVIPYDFVVFLDSGESLTATTTNAQCIWAGSTRQIADKQGNLVNPVGFTSE